VHMLLICLSRIDGYTKKGYDVVECKGRTGVGLMVKTNVMRLLDAAGIAYGTGTYEVDENDRAAMQRTFWEWSMTGCTKPWY
jgi:hypothetical protein